MRLFAPHFARPALLQNAVRHTLGCRKIVSPPAQPFACAPRRPYCAPSTIHAIDDDMGKDDKSKNFTLKVPKGTRDCTLYLTIHAVAMYARRPVLPR
jgi:histidyl-tRNA synthetase